MAVFVSFQMLSYFFGFFLIFSDRDKKRGYAFIEQVLPTYCSDLRPLSYSLKKMQYWAASDSICAGVSSLLRLL